MPYYSVESRFLHLWGGAGSGKSVFAAQKILGRILSEPGHRFVLVRKVGGAIRRSQYQLICDLLTEYNLWGLFTTRRDEMTFDCAMTGGSILSVGLDDREKLKSIAGVTGFWLEEPTELEEQDLTQVNLRMRGQLPHYKQVILSYNPIDANHWLRKRFHNLPMVPLSDGRGKAGHNFTLLQTTWRDNRFLMPEDVAELEELASFDATYNSIYNLGDWATPEHAIFRNWESIAHWPDSFDETFYGLDFGYTKPTALVQISLRNGKVYVRQLLYEKGLRTDTLLERCQELDLDGPIYADAEDPRLIDELYDAGYDVHAAEKGKYSVKAGIDFVKRYRLHVHCESEDLLTEIRSYKWRQDRAGNVLEEPVKFRDHAVDALRYGLFTHGWKYWRLPTGTALPNLKRYHESRRSKSITKGFFE